MYTKIVMDHFKSPRNVGVIEDADGVGEVGNPLCGDMMSIYLKIQNEQIKDIKFQTFGCGAAIAVSSILTEMAKGKSLQNEEVPFLSALCQKKNRELKEFLYFLPFG